MFVVHESKASATATEGGPRIQQRNLKGGQLDHSPGHPCQQRLGRLRSVIIRLFTG